MRYLPLVLILSCLLCGCPSNKSSGVESESGKRTALALLAPPASLTVTLPDIPANQPIPDRYSPNGANETPNIQWSPVPPKTQSFLLLVEDPDAPGANPFVHYLVLDIPPETTFLTSQLPPNTRIGKNSLGKSEYFGPRPPSGIHHYHFQVFALDIALPGNISPTWEAIQSHIKGHILAGGEAVATYAKK